MIQPRTRPGGRSGDRDRGYLTIPDVAYLVAALAVLAALIPLFMTLMNANAGLLNRGQELLLLASIPLSLLVMLTLYFAKAIGGRY